MGEHWSEAGTPVVRAMLISSKLSEALEHALHTGSSDFASQIMAGMNPADYRNVMAVFALRVMCAHAELGVLDPDASVTAARTAGEMLAGLGEESDLFAAIAALGAEARQ